MVVRIKKSSRKYLGTRRWGVGNIKNARGKGDRGGVGRGGRKHKMTYYRVYERDTLKKKGFPSPNRTRLKRVDLYRISEMAMGSSEQKPTIELRGYKVLSDGILEKAVVVRAGSFSKLAEQKIKKAGGEAIRI
jgi:large subunit ribosomal protein L15